MKKTINKNSAKIKTIFAAGVALAIFFAPLTHAEPSDKTVVVYSARAAHLIEPLFDAFTNETGIRVEYLTGKADALVERLKLEAEHTKADMLMTVDAGNLWYAKTQGLFQTVKSDFLDSAIPPYLKDADNQWFGLSVRARTMVYHPGKVSAAELSTYQNLADNRWRGRLCLRSSKKIYNKSLVAAMIFHHGKTETENILKGWVANLAARPYAKDSQVMDAILSGRCDVGLVNTYYYARLKKERPDAPLQLFWANQQTSGTHINISGAGILKHGKNPDDALRLLEWLSSARAQNLYAGLNQEYPANQNIVPSATVRRFGDFKHDKMPLFETGKNQAEAVKMMHRVGYF